MQGWIAVTDYRWYERLLEDELEDDDVNFWQPSARAPKHMPTGTPFFFKLKAPHNAICGFGYFAGFSVLPDWLAWDSFGRANGVSSLSELRERLAKIRRGAKIPSRPEIGCCMIAEAVPSSGTATTSSWGDQPSYSCDWRVGQCVGRLDRPRSVELAPQCKHQACLSPLLNQGMCRWCAASLHQRRAHAGTPRHHTG